MKDADKKKDNFSLSLSHTLPPFSYILSLQFFPAHTGDINHQIL